MLPEQPDSPYREFLRTPATRHALRAARKAAEAAGGRNLDGIAEVALEAGLRALYVTGYLLTSDVREAAIAEGRRQATEGWEREWGTQWATDPGLGTYPCDDEAEAREHVERYPGNRVVSRLVSRWEPADPPQQPEPRFELTGGNLPDGASFDPTTGAVTWTQNSGGTVPAELPVRIRVRHDPGALMEEPDLHPKTFDAVADEDLADEAHMRAMEERMEPEDGAR